MVQPSSEIRQHAVEATGIGSVDVVRLAQVALTLRGHLGEDVAAVGVARLVLAGSGLPEALGRAPMGLDLGHVGVLVSSGTGSGGGGYRAWGPWPAHAPARRPEQGGSGR